MGWEYITHARNEKFIQDFKSHNLMEREKPLERAGLERGYNIKINFKEMRKYFRSLKHWGRVFKSHSRHGGLMCVCAFSLWLWSPVCR
jgi:hypothetical protein